jgi:hypothetical protein
MGTFLLRRSGVARAIADWASPGKVFTAATGHARR